MRLLRVHEDVMTIMASHFDLEIGGQKKYFCSQFFMICSVFNNGRF
jgi:hypothetical protein